jgi:ubiquinone/menaquinone biosynthesis C-methylase UbiE
MTSPAAGAAPALYDRIGLGYDRTRRPDPRLAALIRRALDGARTVLNVGAGAGSHEPEDLAVTAVEPCRVMLDQHPDGAQVQATAEALPFRDGAFDAAMAVMTVHHWRVLARGLRELRRVAPRQVVFTWDPGHRTELWLLTEYLPETGEMDHGYRLLVAG